MKYMKYIIKYSLLTIIVGAMITLQGCDEERWGNIPNLDEYAGAVTLIQVNPDKNFFNALNDLSGEAVEFDLDVDGFELTDINSVDIELIYTEKDATLDAEGNPADVTYDAVLIKTVNTFPSTVSFTAMEAVDAIKGFKPGFTIDSLEVGDGFNLIFPINTADGRRLTTALSSDLCNEPVQPSFGGCNVAWKIACPSEIPAGPWEVFVAASATTYTVNITANGAGSYGLDNFNLDYDLSFYDSFDNLPISGGFTDVCNTVSLDATGDFGVQWRGTGTYDPEAGTITFGPINDPAYGQGPWDNNGTGSYVLTYVGG